MAKDWMAVASAVKVSACYEAHLGSEKEIITPAQKARSWFISSFPLLGALAADFTIFENAVLCNRLESRAEDKLPTPDIARPRWAANSGSDDGRTFGVILDTSGSGGHEASR